MEEHETFEERIGPALDFLFDGASLLFDDPRRAEELVVATVLELARRYGKSEASRDFRRWVVAGLVRRYLRQPDAEPEAGIDEPAGSGEAAGRRPPSGRGLPRDEALEALVTDLAVLERRSPTRLREAIRGCLRALPGRQRLSVWLVDVMQFSYPEATEAMGLEAEDFRTTLYVGRRRLQRLLGPAARAAVGELEETPWRGGEA